RRLVSREEVLRSVEEAKRERQKAIKEEKTSSKEKGKEKEKKKEKIVKPLVFNNGAMVSSVEELLDALPPMSISVFGSHVNQSKNDIKDWVEKEFKDEELIKAVSVLTKKEMIDNLKKYLEEKNKNQDKSKEKEEKEKKEEK
ncbi:MAG: hypothetical protein QXU20_04955, partial [Candidatus Woesearchaeota archaeon]